jgi:hypothetical protein
MLERASGGGALSAPLPAHPRPGAARQRALDATKSGVGERGYSARRMAQTIKPVKVPPSAPAGTVSRVQYIMPHEPLPSR